MKRVVSLLLVLLMTAAMLSGCGGSSRSSNDYENSYSSNSDSGGNESGGMTAGFSSSVVSGSWGEQFARSRGRSYPFGMDEPPEGDMGYTFPFVFDEPLRACKGFTLEYEIMEISHGNLDGNFRYEVLVHTVQGDWKSAGLFDMDGYSATVEVRMEEPRGIDAVAVVCGKQDKLIYSFDLTVKDPV